jgi:glycosyltransferase involved in cell wall biosynthesis
MKLLFFNAVGAIGGAERVLLTMFQGLKKRHPNVELFLIVGTEGGLIKAAENLDVKVICLSLPQSVTRLGDSGLKARSKLKKLEWVAKTSFVFPQLFGYLKLLQNTIQSIQPDLIHSNSIKTHILLAALRQTQVPIVWHIHDFYQSRPLVARILQWAQHSATCAIAVSNAVAKDAKGLLSTVPIQVIYNAVQIESCDRQTQNQTINVGLVATFARWKGHDIFLQAASQVVANLPDLPIQFLIVGAPIYQTQGSQFSIAELEAEVARLRLDRWVQFLGFQPEMAAIYQSLDIVVHASTQPEPFGLVIAEAMALGKAVIVAKAGGAAELVTHEVDAIAVTPADAQALSHAISQLIQAPQKRQQLGQNAKRTAAERYNGDRMVTELLNIYHPCIAAKTRKSRESAHPAFPPL